ncbi:MULTISPECIES: thiamine pyrophosphate-dependent enzyme [Bacteria]|jgi:transketolase|uniref:hypothetical protein n=1 Tax=Bacteria TaxID=2 RepID=UPI00082E8CAC|nr:MULTISPECIES: hypothetical protein [Bacteria]
MNKDIKALRKFILDIAYYGKDANLQSIFSSVEILWTLYYEVMNYDIDNMNDPNRDVFILSKGQSTMGVLAILAQKGFFDKKEIEKACQYNSFISMQADRTKVPGFEVSAGSLGHGFPIASGVAYGKKIQSYDGHVYILAGDGEMNEGTMWESALFCGSEKLNNLTLIIDDNHSIDAMIDIRSMEEKLKVFGFEVLSVHGHDTSELKRALLYRKDRPIAVIAETIRGYGSSTIMTDNTWFHRAPLEEELIILKKEIDDFE